MTIGKSESIFFPLPAISLKSFVFSFEGGSGGRGKGIPEAAAVAITRIYVGTFFGQGNEGKRKERKQLEGGLRLTEKPTLVT